MRSCLSFEVRGRMKIILLVMYVTTSLWNLCDRCFHPANVSAKWREKSFSCSKICYTVVSCIMANPFYPFSFLKGVKEYNRCATKWYSRIIDALERHKNGQKHRKQPSFSTLEKRAKAEESLLKQ